MSNMALLAKADGALNIRELGMSVRESLEYLTLTGQTGDLIERGGEHLFPSSLILFAYRLFETLIENTYDTAHAISVVLEGEESSFEMRILTDAEDTGFGHGSFADELSSLGATLTIGREDGTVCLSLSCNNAGLPGMKETAEKTRWEAARGEEMLKARAAVHDGLGRCLLVTKRFLLKPGSIGEEELLLLWRKTLRDLGGEEKPPDDALGERLKDTAAQLGLSLDVSGSPPGEVGLRKIMESAIFTHMTNVSRHAHGTRVKAVYGEADGNIGLTLTNDGEVPDTAVKEGGGLKNLRERTEALGGTMRVESSPRFRLMIAFPAAGERKEQTWHTAL